MIVEVILVAIAAYIFLRATSDQPVVTAAAPLARPVSPQLASNLAYADRLFAEKKWNGAEKAYLEVLKHDHKNLTAYSHLGIIYSTQKNYVDAIECFELAVRFRPAASTYQNLAMAFYENKNYIKAIAAFEKSIMFEPNAPRYIGLSKAYRKINNLPHMVTALERAAEIDPTGRILEMLATGYAEAGRFDDSRAIDQRILELQTVHGQPAPAKSSAKALPTRP